MTFGHAIIAALGPMALRACWVLAPVRPLVRALALVIAAVVATRAYAPFVGGQRRLTTMRCLSVEGELAGPFPGWPSPVAP